MRKEVTAHVVSKVFGDERQLGPAICKFAVWEMLRGRRMADLCAALPRGIIRLFGVSGAASARSEKINFTVGLAADLGGAAASP